MDGVETLYNVFVRAKPWFCLSTCTVSLHLSFWLYNYELLKESDEKRQRTVTMRSLLRFNKSKPFQPIKTLSCLFHQHVSSFLHFDWAEEQDGSRSILPIVIVWSVPVYHLIL